MMTLMLHTGPYGCGRTRCPGPRAFRHRKNAMSRVKGKAMRLVAMNTRIRGPSEDGPGNPLYAKLSALTTWLAPTAIAIHPRNLGYALPSASASPKRSRVIP